MLELNHRLARQRPVDPVDGQARRRKAGVEPLLEGRHKWSLATDFKHHSTAGLRPLGSVQITGERWAPIGARSHCGSAGNHRGGGQRRAHRYRNTLAAAAALATHLSQPPALTRAGQRAIPQLNGRQVTSGGSSFAYEVLKARRGHGAPFGLASGVS